MTDSKCTLGWSEQRKTAKNSIKAAEEIDLDFRSPFKNISTFPNRQGIFDLFISKRILKIC